MIDARVASLLSFYQSRSSGDCEKQAGGKFADGNDCAKSSGGGQDQKKPAASGGGTMPSGKVEDPSAAYSWLSPSGTFHPFPRSKPPQLRLKSPQGFTSHDEWAKLHGVEGGEKELLSKGWVRVLRSGPTLYATTADGVPLSSSQRRSLKDHAIIIGGYDEVLHDSASGGRARRTVWAKDQRSADCGRDNGGRFGPKNTCQEMGDEFKPMPHGDWKSLKPEPGYVYHATSHEAAADITEGGLLTFGPSHGTDQDAWPDGSDKDRAYFATSPATAYSFAPESGKPVLLRVPRLDSMEDESGTGDVVSHSPVDASKLEALGADGSWVPLRRTPASPSFDKWFEDSQVVDADGRPKVLFHGTDATFDEFDAGEFGFHFGDEQAASMQGGSSMPVVLSIKNPLRLKDLGVWNPDRVLKAIRKEADIPKEAIDLAEDESDKLHEQLVDRLEDDDDFHDARKAHYEWSTPVRELLDRHGYDGIVYQNEAEGFGDSYIAFRPEQIKSAAENSGDYDPTKKNIRRSFCPTGKGGGVDNSCGSNEHGDVSIEENNGKKSKLFETSLGDEATHVIRVESGGQTKAYMLATIISDSGTVHVMESHVAEKFRNKGVYTSLLKTLSQKYLVESDDQLSPWAEKAYKKLGAVLINRTGRYELDNRPSKKNKRSADCGRDEGGRFGKGNTCQALLDQLGDVLGDHESEGGKLVGGLRDKFGEQTDVARKLNQMGVKEEALADLIKKMGGQPSKARSQIAKHVIHIAVVSHKGEDLYHIDLGYMEAKIYSTGKSDQDLEKIKDAAARTFPSTYFRKGTPFEVHMHDSDDDFKEGKFNDKSSRSLSLRMESLKAFYESRNCGTGPGGFQPGNTCAHSKTADVAAGAAKGAAFGAGSAVVSFAPYPPYMAKGAAIGAVVGAAQGLSNNLTRSGRIKAKISEIGTTERKVASMVKKLGGTEKTKADVKGEALHITVVNSKGQKTFNVDMTKSKITVYPRRATGKLSDAEITRVKSIAKSSVPKTTEIVVKSNSQAYVAKLIRSGFKVLANTAGALIAAYVIPEALDLAEGEIKYELNRRRRAR